MNQYLLLVSVHLKEEYVARTKKEDLGCFVIINYQNTTEGHAQIPLYSKELQQRAEAVGEGKKTRAEKQVTGMKTVFRITYPVNEFNSYRDRGKPKDKKTSGFLLILSPGYLSLLACNRTTILTFKACNITNMSISVYNFYILFSCSDFTWKAFF